MCQIQLAQAKESRYIGLGEIGKTIVGEREIAESPTPGRGGKPAAAGRSTLPARATADITRGGGVVAIVRVAHVHARTRWEQMMHRPQGVVREVECVHVLEVKEVGVQRGDVTPGQAHACYRVQLCG